MPPIVFFPANWPPYSAMLWLMSRGRSTFDLYVSKEDGRRIYIEEDRTFIFSASEDEPKPKRDRPTTTPKKGKQ